MSHTKPRKRTLGALAAVAGLIGAVAIVVPSLAAASPSVVRLHLGSDGRYFAYGDVTQPLATASGSCALASPEPLIDLGAGGPSHATPGLKHDSLGVKSNSSGRPCAQVSGSESLTLRRGPSLGGRRFSGVRLDVEVTGNAVVKAVVSSSTRSELYVLQTGRSISSSQQAEPDYDSVLPYLASSGPGDQTDACASPSASGPNSGPSDNCQWTIMPDFEFDSITLYADGGTVSLEGGGDHGSAIGDFETLLYLAGSPPVAEDDAFTTNEDTSVSGNVLGNDTDPDGGALSAVIGDLPADGDVTLASDGGFTYTPDPDWFGTDSFTYLATDGDGETDEATVTITVDPVNDPPEPIEEPEPVVTDEDTPVTVPVGTDIDGPTIVAECTVTDEEGAEVPGAVVVSNGDGTVDLTPPPNFNGTLVLTCSLTDGEATAESETIVVIGVDPVNDPPVAVDDEAEVATAGSVAIDVLANDTDVDGDPLTIVDVGDVLPAGATAVASSGQVIYTPPPDYDGPGSFTYRAADAASQSVPATVSVEVYPTICTQETVSDEDDDTSGEFTRLEDSEDCKRYVLDTDDEDGTVTFVPEGGDVVSYRGFVSLGAEAAPAPGGPGSFPLLLRYDPAGGTDYRPVQWCTSAEFDEAGIVTSATLPPGEAWCIVGADLRANGTGDIVTVWQVYGRDDPRFTR